MLHVFADFNIPRTKLTIVQLVILYKTVNLLGLRSVMILTRVVSWSETPKHAESTPLLFAFLYHYELLPLSFQLLPVANFEIVEFFQNHSCRQISVVKKGLV